MTQKVLTKIFESLLNTAAQAPTDDIVNRDGISLMKQGFELIMQAHCEGGATGPTSQLLADARQLLADIEVAQVRTSPPVSLTTISEQLTRMEARMAPVRIVVAPAVEGLKFSPEEQERFADFLRDAVDQATAEHLHKGN
ncbi:hypothetical protein [Aeromonas hydrophila]|uniref:hypothetical protein n=1 Tax=Aeromonas hydrophila TaxID=644 RepID=UPI003D1A06D8